MRRTCVIFDIDGTLIDGYRRIDIMKRCRSLMTATEATVYVGDGEWDQRASELLGWRFVGVGARLHGKCSRWLPDFSDPQLLQSLCS